MLQDHSEWITLSNGITAELKLLGTASFDLAGEIQLSIWSRVAHSVVEKKYVFNRHKEKYHVFKHIIVLLVLELQFKVY